MGGVRRCMLGCLSASLLIACSARSPFVTPTNVPDFFVAGYHPWWAGDAWTAYPYDVLTELYYFEIEVAGDGSFLDRHGWPERWTSLIERTMTEGVQLTPTLSMHDAAAFEELFANEVAVALLIEEALALHERIPGMAGLHIDFEVFQPIDPAAREGFGTFIQELKRALVEVDPTLALSVFTLALDADDAYDERAIAAAADYLILQGYDFHSAGGDRAGPVAPVDGWGLNWGSVLDRFLELGVPRRKLVMAVPLYGYEWPTETDALGSPTRGAGVATPLAPPDETVRPELPRASQRVDEHGAERGPDGNPYYAYEADDGWYQGWYEDSESLARKYDFVRREGLGGVAIFPLAYGNESHWAALREAFSRPRS